MSTRPLFSLAAFALLAPALAAQDVQETELPKPNAASKDLLKQPYAIRELADGRLLLADGKLQKLVRVDLGKGTLEEVMSQGAEPNQYRNVFALWSWPGDSVAMVDLGRVRLNVLAPDGTPVRSMAAVDTTAAPPAETPPPVSGRGGGGAPAGPRGPRLPLSPRFLVNGTHVYGTGFPAQAGRVPPGTTPPRVTLPILKMSLATFAIDTIAQIVSPQQNKRSEQTQNQANNTFAVTLFYDPTPLIPGDVWFAYHDGTVGILRGVNYRIDLIAPDGTRSKLEPIPYPKVEVTEAEKKMMMESFKKSQEALYASATRRPSGINFEDGLPWPKEHPPFSAQAGVQVDSKDRVWVHVRCASTEKVNCYDVIDREGKRVHRYRFPANTYLAAVGKNAIYTVDTSKEDKPVLQRHPIS